MGRSTSLYTKACVIPKPQQAFLDLSSYNLREMLFALLSFPMDSYLCCKCNLLKLNTLLHFLELLKPSKWHFICTVSEVVVSYLTSYLLPS